MSFFDTDPKKPIQGLLENVRSAAQQSHMPGLPLAPFATLLVRVSVEAHEAIESLKAHITSLNEKNAKLQWWVVALAIFSLIGTIAQVYIAFRHP